MLACNHHCWLSVGCARAGPFCTPRLQEELTRLSFQALYDVYEMCKLTREFWSLASKIIEILHSQVSLGL